MLSELWTLQNPLRWREAIEAAAAVLMATASFTLAGTPQAGLVASMGVFSIFYFTTRSYQYRLVATPFVACGLILSAYLGALSGHSTAALPICTMAVIAGVSAGVLQMIAAGPPGALMFTVTAGVAARIVSTGATNPLRIATLVAIGAGIGYLVLAVAALLLHRTWKEQPVAMGTPGVSSFRLIGRLMVAAVAAGACSLLFRVGREYWAVASAVAVLASPSIQFPIERAFHRVIGSVTGVGVFALIALAHPQGLVLCAALAVLQAAGEILVAASYSLAMVFITPTALLIASAGATASWPSAQVRLLDTAVGAAAALVVAWLIPVVKERRPGRHS